MNQCRTCKPSSNPKTPHLFRALILLWTAGACLERPPVSWLPLTDLRTPSTQVSFYLWDLLHEGTELGEIPTPEESSARAPKNLRSGPGFVESAEGLCFLERPIRFHEQESGLRVSYCGLPVLAQEAEVAAGAIQHGHSATALPELRRGLLRIAAERYSDLRKERWEVAVVCGPGLEEAYAPERTALVLTCLPHAVGQAAFGELLPATFPTVAFAILVAENRALFIYPTDRSTHALAIEIRDAGFRASMLDGLRLLPELLRRLQSISKSAALRATEAGGESILPAPYSNGFVELAHRERAPVRDRVRVAFAEKTADYDLLVLPGAVAILPLPRGRAGDVFSGRSTAALPGDEGFVFERSAFGHAGKRTLDLENANNPSALCSLGEPCGSPGVHPDLARRWAAQDGAPALCESADVALNELNPFGLSLLPSGTPEPSGKFVEVIALRACRTDSLLFTAGETVISPGHRLLERGDILLFVADREWYSAEVTVEAPELAKLEVTDPVTVRSLAESAVSTLRAAPEQNTHYFPSTPRTSEGEPTQESHLHSLEQVFCSGVPCERFTKADGQGLRPHLRAFHSMSPGGAQTQVSEERGHEITELLPAGGRGSGGESLPAEEFIEFHAESGERGGMLELSIVPRDGGAHYYRFVPPRTAGYFAFARDGRTCFPTETSVNRWAVLSLPNGPATYALTNSAGRTTELVVEEALFRGLDGPVRRSLTRVNGETWSTADGQGSIVAQCSFTRAGPGRFTSFVPFVSEDAGGAGFTFFGAEPERALLELSCDARPPVFPSPEPGPDLVPNTTFEVTAPSGEAGRCMLQIRGSNSGLLWSGDLYPMGARLYFELVYATPGPGEHEWVRVCTETAFDLDSHGLEIVDSRSADVLVPWQVRHGFPFSGGPSSTATHLHSGRCALILDPDTAALPPLDPRDAAIWTTQAGSALGDGLGAAEGLLLRERSTGITLGTFGLPDSPIPWAPAPRAREAMKRVPGTTTDRQRNFVVAPAGELR